MFETLLNIWLLKPISFSLIDLSCLRPLLNIWLLNTLYMSVILISFSNRIFDGDLKSITLLIELDYRFEPLLNP